MLGPMDILIVGVDCATSPSRVGIAVAQKTGQQNARVIEAGMASGQCSLAETLANKIRNQTTLLALDAPLGWPEALGRMLVDHRAGRLLDERPEMLFSRQTDRFIRRTFSKAPLEVGADRIARTGWAALQMIAELEKWQGNKIDLAWRLPILPRAVQAIEVYPAATLRAHGLPATRYRKSWQEGARSEMLSSLKTLLDFDKGVPASVPSADVLDALLCVLAADDFLRGESAPPEDPTLAHREGWIWARRPLSSNSRSRK